MAPAALSCARHCVYIIEEHESQMQEGKIHETALIFSGVQETAPILGAFRE
jgi:hypothetical protein